MKPANRIPGMPLAAGPNKQTGVSPHPLSQEPRT